MFILWSILYTLLKLVLITRIKTNIKATYIRVDKMFMIAMTLNNESEIDKKCASCDNGCNNYQIK